MLGQKIKDFNDAFSRSGVARKAGFRAELTSSGKLMYTRDYPNKPGSRMKVGFSDALFTLEKDDLRALSSKYGRK